MPTDLLLLGAGGHAKVVVEAIQEKYHDCQIILVDQDSTKEGSKLLGSILIGSLHNWTVLPDLYHVAIGDNQERSRLSAIAQDEDKIPFTLIHPEAYVSPSARIGSASFVAAKAIISAEAEIGEGCIINHGAIVDHDCKIGSYTHIAPNATLGGSVEVGSRCLLGSGASILPGVKIGCDVVIGAGAVINCDIPDNQKVIGVPGRSVD